MGRPKVSVVWDFFYQRSEAKFFINICSLCGFEIKVENRSKANTSNLTKHLQTRHQTEFEEAKANHAKKDAEKQKAHSSLN